MSEPKTIYDASDLKAAAALFAIEEVGFLLDRLSSTEVNLKACIRSETQSAVLSGLEELSQQQEQLINRALNRLKIRTSLVEPKHYSLQWLLATALIALLSGVLIGIGLANHL